MGMQVGSANLSGHWNRLMGDRGSRLQHVLAVRCGFVQDTVRPWLSLGPACVGRWSDHHGTVAQACDGGVVLCHPARLLPRGTSR